MKAHTIGRRNKWKDYVDLFWILKYKYHTLDEINFRAKELFKGEYNMKLFRSQLSYFEDIDYSEEVDWVGKKYDKKEIEEFLIEVAIAE